MKEIKIINETKKEAVISNCLLASTFFSRLKGLLGKSKLEKDEGLCLRPCRSVHTFLMRFPIDIIYVNRENKVLKIIENLGANRISPYLKEAYFIIELNAFGCRKKNIEIGDKLSFNPPLEP